MWDRHACRKPAQQSSAAKPLPALPTLDSSRLGSWSSPLGRSSLLEASDLCLERGNLGDHGVNPACQRLEPGIHDGHHPLQVIEHLHLSVHRVARVVQLLESLLHLLR